MSTDEAELARLRELEAAATPGPWLTGKGHMLWVQVPEGGLQVAEFDEAADGFLAAEARNLLPTLLDALEAAEEKVARAETLFQCAPHSSDPAYAEFPEMCLRCKARHEVRAALNPEAT